jgi:hypothetical protein
MTVLYVNDNKNYLPPTVVGQWDMGGWSQQLAPYAGYGRSDTAQTNPYLGGYNPNYYSIPINSSFYCPMPASGTSAVVSSYRWPYAMNHDLRQRGISGLEPADTTAMRMDEFIPTQTMAFTEDTVFSDLLSRSWVYYAIYTDGLPAMTRAHAGLGLPFAYLDGHAAFWARQIVPDWEPMGLGIYMTDPRLPWTHKAFWGWPANGPSYQYASADAPNQ